jgi:hypothetical protein
MGSILRRIALLALTGIAAAFMAASSVRADTGDGQLLDFSKQLADMQRKVDDLRSRGLSSRTGKLSAEATCGFGNPFRAFLPWGDPATYTLAPQGDLASTSRWSLKNVVSSPDHNPFVGGVASLLFARGDSEAITPVMCMSVDNPTIRLFLADRGGNGKAGLEVKVLYEGVDGAGHSLTVARLHVGDDWQPSVVIPMGVNLLAAVSAHGWTPVAFDFKVKGLQKGETFSLDGLYVDPWGSRGI